MSDFNPSPEFEEKVRKAVDVPNAKPEFVNKLRNELARRPAKMKPRFMLKPAWAFAFVIVALTLIASAPAAVNALKKIFGYVPGVGLVESTNGLRILAEPVSVTRDGVTLTITNVFVYPDHIELQYEVKGIAPENDGWQSDESSTNPTAFCGGVNVGDTFNKASDVRLRLPDGTILERDYTGKYPKNMFAMQPVYDAVLPADITSLTFVLDCIPQARLGVVPANWEIPLNLVEVPAGTVVGEPVTEIPQPIATKETPASPLIETVSAPKVTMTLERIVSMETNTIIYLHFNMENADPSLISIMPEGSYMHAYVIDSLGQKIPLRGNFILQPSDHKVGSSFEYMTEFKPTEGALTVVVGPVIAYYAPLYTDPPLATPEEMTFTFDAGENPQHGQEWDVNAPFIIAGYDFEVASVKAVSYEDIQPFFDGSQGYEYGYQFSIKADPSLGMVVDMDIMKGNCWLYEEKPLLYTQLCKDSYPTGQVPVTISRMSITILDDIQAEWRP